MKISQSEADRVNLGRRSSLKAAAAFGASLVLPAAMARSSRAATDSPDLPEADALFKAGDFPAAEAAYARLLKAKPQLTHAALQLGYLALLSNKLSDAERWLRDVRRADPENQYATQFLAETLYRQDRFAEAAALLKGGPDDVKAQLLSSFGERTPYLVEGEAELASVDFVQLDPIPVVKLVANGREGYFIIDTGGSEVYLEPEFAAQIGVDLVGGAQEGGFAAGQSRPVQKGRLDSLKLDAFTVRNLPVNIVDTSFIGSDVVAKGIKISGFIGTILFYHFLPTLDYPGRRLVLRKKTPANLRAFETDAQRGEQNAVRFWMAGDHLMVTRASAHGGPSHLFLVDTGGAGVGFVPGQSYVKEAGLEMPNGGAGWEKAGAYGIRFTTDIVTVGPLSERNIPSSFGPFPSAMEPMFGFYMAGIVSHEFFKHYALTVDFTGMRFFLKRGA